MIDSALRFAELEADLRQRDDKIAELEAKVKKLTGDLDEAEELVGQMRQRVEDDTELISSFIEVVEYPVWDEHAALQDEHRKLIAEWDKFVGKYNAVFAPRERGRPLAASAAQQAEVVRRRKAGETLPAIATATSLSLRTVRTITDKAAGKGRAGKRRNELRRKEFDRLRAARFRVHKKAHDQLPEQIAEVQKTGEALIKAAKGLGR